MGDLEAEAHDLLAAGFQIAGQGKEGRAGGVGVERGELLDELRGLVDNDLAEDGENEPGRKEDERESDESGNAARDEAGGMAVDGGENWLDGAGEKEGDDEEEEEFTKPPKDPEREDEDKNRRQNAGGVAIEEGHETSDCNWPEGGEV